MKGCMTCDECGFTSNTTIKYPCGGCDNMWQPTDDTLHEVPGEQIILLTLAKKLKFIELLGTKNEASLEKVASAVATSGGAKYLTHSAFGLGKPSMIIDETTYFPSEVDEPEGTIGTLGITLNTTEANSEALHFPTDSKGNVIVPQHVLAKCAENLDRLRAQRNDIRNQYRTLQRAHMETLGQNPVEIRKAAIKGIMQRWDKFVARRRTIWDEPGLSARQRAQRVRRCNEESTVIMHELLSAVMSGQLEELPGEPSEVG